MKKILLAPNAAKIWGVVFTALLATGCKSTIPSTSRTTAPPPVVNPAPVNKPDAPVEPVVAFEQVPVTDSDMVSVAKQFPTISLTKYQLEEHGLVKTELTNDILFQIDSASSYNIAASDIQAVAQVFNTGKVGKYLYVVGHTDSRGDDAYNLRLSLRRAMSVATKLTNEGVKVERIKLVPAGEYMPIAKNTSGSYAKNRRVDILSADSKALMSAYIREQDCQLIDPACKQSELSILDIEHDKDVGIVIKADRYDSVTVAAPAGNDLKALSSDLRQLGGQEVDRREQTISERERLGPAMSEVRDTFKMDIIIREPLVFKPKIRDILRFAEKYIIE